MATPARFASLCCDFAPHVALAFTEKTTLAEVRALLDELPPDWAIHFFDADFHSPSDPGAYVTAVRRDDRFWYKRANHGWTGNWVRRRPQAMATMVHRCRCHRDRLDWGGDPGVTVGRVEPALCRPLSATSPDRAWLTSAVLAIAKDVRARRAFDRLALLADALEDAGCGDETILGHLRADWRQHRHWCWVADWLLGKG